MNTSGSIEMRGSAARISERKRLTPRFIVSILGVMAISLATVRCSDNEARPAWFTLDVGTHARMEQDVQASAGHGAMVCETATDYVNGDSSGWKNCKFTRVGELVTVESWTGGNSVDGGLVQVVLPDGSSAFANLFDLQPVVPPGTILHVLSPRNATQLFLDKKTVLWSLITGSRALSLKNGVKVKLLSELATQPDLYVRVLTGKFRGRYGYVLSNDLQDMKGHDAHLLAQPAQPGP